MEHVFTLEEHSKTSHVSVKEYLRSKSMRLQQSFEEKTLVYLDTKFWLILRDVELRRNQNPNSVSLYKSACRLKEEGRCLFPVSQDVFLEVMQQSDDLTRVATARLIDKLSDGICFISIRERVGLETLQFFAEKAGLNVHPVEKLVWTKIVYALGFITPETFLKPEINAAIQKAFMDQMWTATFGDVVRTIGFDEDLARLCAIDIANDQNEGKIRHAHENNSFSEMFLSELAGFLDVWEPELQYVMHRLRELETGCKMNDCEINEASTPELVSKVIYNLFRLKKISTELPTFRIKSGLYAAARWDKERKFQNNDFHDFQHAATALPYANYFFTEKSLAHLITQKMTAYDRLYNCTVVSNVSSALCCLRAIG